MLQDSKVRGGAAIQILRGGKYEPKGETERRERERNYYPWGKMAPWTTRQKGLVRIDYPWKSSRKKRLICRGGNEQRKTKEKESESERKKSKSAFYLFS